MFVKELEYTMRLLSLLFLLIAFNSFAVIDKAKYFTIFKVNSLPDIKNIIYRFLRFVIQENCPKILKYNTQIRTDSNIIRQNYKSLDKITKEFVRDYAKKSEVLNL